MSKMGKTTTNPFRKGWLSFCMLFFMGAMMYGQSIVRGTVTDSRKEPLVGVTILVKGSNTGATTDVDGNYSISVPSNGALRFSYVGYVNHEEPVNGRSSINVVLHEDSQQVEEVVVVAYGTAKKSTFTGSIASVSSEKLNKITASNVTETLQGMSPGLSVLNNVGDPGSDAKINIRGIGSMSASTNPLYVLDGVPYDGNLSAISSSDIESITVLKDAAASSLYGSRAANGVIMITTKRGNSEKPRVNFKGTWGTSDLAVKYPRMGTPSELFELTWEALYNDAYYVNSMSDGDARQYAVSNLLPKLLNPRTNSQGQTVYVNPYNTNTPIGLDGKLDPSAQLLWNESDWNWIDAMISRKLRQEYTLDVSGMTNDGKSDYYFSGSFLDDKGHSLAQSFERYTLRARANTQITPWLKMGLNLSYTHSMKNNSSGNIRVLRVLPSYASPWLRNDDNTDWIYSEKTGDRMLDYAVHRREWYGWNPLASAGDSEDNPNSYDYSNTINDMVSARAYAEVKLADGLTYRSNFSVDNNVNYWLLYGSAIHGLEQLPPYGIAVKPAGGWASRDSYRSTSYTWNNLLTYEKTFAEKHNLNVLLGHELYSYKYYGQQSYGAGIPLGDLFETASTTQSWSAWSSTDNYALLSLFGKVDYNFDGKYYLSASYRRDGSSRFSPDNRWGNFFSAGASWRLTGEEFLSEVNWLDNLLVRASYGTTGNDQLSTYYAYQGTYAMRNLYNNAGLRIQKLATPDLRWEKNEQFNVGVDVRVLNRFYASVEYFRRNSNDLLYYKELPPSAQAGSATGYNTNIGDIRNSGIEVALGAEIFNTKDFRWSIDANLTQIKNELTYLPEGEYTYSEGWGTFKMVEGRSRYEFWAPSYSRVDPATGDVLYWKKDENGNRVETSDYNEVNVEEQKDFKGSSLPKVYGSITNTFAYKDFDFSFMFYYSLGGKMLDHQYMESIVVRTGFGIAPDLLENRWKQPGDVAELPRLREQNYIATRQYSDAFIFNNDYLRLRNITLGYTLPKSLTHKIRLDHVRVFFTGDNLLTFGAAKKRGSDPETDLSGVAQDGKYDTNSWGAANARKTMTGGIQISF